MLGIMLGAWTCNYLYVRRMNWLHNKQEQIVDPACKSKIQVFMDKFKPNVWTRYDWSMFKSPKRFN